jgi:hypothetical protein
VLLKYGRHGGGHGHPDKLAIVLAGAGERLAPDLGTPGYGIALNDTWYRHTLSHNTVLVDGQPQPPATGRLLAFSAPSWRSRPPGDAPGRGVTDGETVGPPFGAPFGLIDAAVAWPADAHDAVLGDPRAARRAREGSPGVYDGVTLRRLVLVRPHYVVDLLAVTCPEARSIEWAYHNLGNLLRLEPGASGQPAGRPYGAEDGPAVPEPLRLRDAVPGDDDVRAAFATGAAGLDLWLRGVPGSSVLAAEAPANPASETMALILWRCRRARALFAAVFHPHRGRPAVRTVSWSRAGGVLRCEVHLRGATDRWEIPLPREDRPARPRLSHQADTPQA